MAIVFGTVVSGSGTLQPVIASVPAGALVGCLVAQHAAANRTYSATSSLGGTFAAERVHDATINRVGAVLYTRNAAAGLHTLSVAPDSGSTAYQAVAFYATDDDALAVPIVSTFVNAASRTHYCGAVGEIDTAGAATIVAVTVFESAPGGTWTGATNFTGMTGAGSAALQVYFQWQDAASAVTDERVEWSYTGGTARASVGIVVAFPQSAPPATNTWGRTGGSWIGL